MPVNIKIQEPNGQQISVIAHYNAEMEDFLRSVDLNKYNIERNVFGLSVNKASAAFLNVNFRSPNSSLGATGYNGRSVSNVTGGQTSVYYIELIRGSNFEQRVRTEVSQSMRTRDVDGGNSTFTGGGLTTTPSDTGGGNMLSNPMNGGDVIIIVTDADWRNLNLHQITEKRVTVRPPRDGGPDPRDPNPPVIGPPLVYEPPTREPRLIGSGQIYVPFATDDIMTETEIVTGPLWSCDENLLASSSGDILKATGSGQENTLDYKLNVHYRIASGSTFDYYTGSEDTQYSIIYGDYHGSGSTSDTNIDSETLTRAMYIQYRNILLPKGQDKFEISGSEQDYIYVIDVKRDRYKSVLDPGNWELTIGNDTLVDSSMLESDSIIFTNKVYSIYSGSRTDGVFDSNNEYGLFYPNHGMIVLSGKKLDDDVYLTTGRNSNTSDDNTEKLYNIIGDFYGRYAHKKYNKMCFVRVKSQRQNYSNNPTYVTGSEGEIIEELRGENLAYFTTIGIYNNVRELLAVGKISRAIRSDFKDESLFAVKIGH